MKLNKEFLAHNSGNESYLVAMGGADFSGLIRGNRTLGILLDMLREEMTEEELVAAMKARFADAPPETIESDVAMLLEKLRSVGALDE